MLLIEPAELRPYLLQAQGTPVDLAFRVGAHAAPKIIGNEVQLHAACGG